MSYPPFAPWYWSILPEWFPVHMTAYMDPDYVRGAGLVLWSW